MTEFLLGNKAECVNEVNKFAQGIGICHLQHLRVGKICELLGNRESQCCDRNILGCSKEFGQRLPSNIGLLLRKL